MMSRSILVKCGVALAMVAAAFGEVVDVTGEVRGSSS